MAKGPIETTIEVNFRGKRFTSAAEGLRAYAERTGKSLDAIAPVLRETFRWYLDNVAKALTSRHSGPWPGGTTKDTLSVRSGDLMKSVRDSVRVEGSTLNTVQGTIGGNRYAKTHEYGATIVPKNAKFLAIPLPAALDSRGVPLKVGPRAWSGTFVFTSKAGNKIIAQRKGKTIIPLYVLKSKVVIPARLGLRDTLKTGMGVFTDRVMKDMLRAIKDAK